MVNLSDVFIPNTWPYVVNSKAAGGEEPGHSRCTLTASIKDVGMWKKKDKHTEQKTDNTCSWYVCVFSKHATIPFDTFCDTSLNRLHRTRCAFTITIITNLNLHHLNYNTGKLITQMLWKLMCCISPQASHVVSLSLNNIEHSPKTSTAEKRANPGTHSDAGLSSPFLDAQRSAVVVFLKKDTCFPETASSRTVCHKSGCHAVTCSN